MAPESAALQEDCECCAQACQCGDCAICTEAPIRIQFAPIYEAGHFRPRA
ncbi:MAG: hypothetical protein ABR562_03505 [Thermoplasmatota archaeon]|nr:hypothetical protein [Halobacteriales archaeon]